MAWEWSHTQEAYDNARKNLDWKTPDWIRTAWAEIQSAFQHEGRTDYEFDKDAYDIAINRAFGIAITFMAEDIWAFAEEYRTCTNGGRELYMCPFGCHTVSCDLEPR